MSFKSSLHIFVSILVMLLLANNSFASDTVIASVGKYEVTQSEIDFAAKMAGLGERDSNGVSQFDKLSVDAKKVVAQRLINDKVLEEQSKKEKINEQDDVAMAIRAILVSKYIEKHSGNLDVLAKRKYDETVGSLNGKKTYTIFHILVKDKNEAEKIYKQISGKGKKWFFEFKKLAKERSIDTATAKNGGLVGSVPEMKLPADFLSNIQNAKTNTLIKPFKTNLGYHIVTVEKIEPIHIEPYDKVKQVFIGQVFQEETERLAKENLHGKEIKFEFEASK